MNGKMGVLVNFLYDIVEKFGWDFFDGVGVLIDFNVMNEDIVGFCGIVN